MNKNPFVNIISLLPYDFKYKIDNTTEYVIPAKPTTTVEPTITYSTTSIGAWKTDADATHDDYIAVFKRASRKSTVNLPAKVNGKVYLVSAEVAAVARKIEDRDDIITPADLIRARYNNNRYVRFLNDADVPTT